MRKQTKYVAVLSAAALLAMGASMTSFAAGWEKDETGAWHYYDKDDDMVTGEWKKDGNKWFYLDDDGNMAVDKWVEDDYYVGEDGAMITNGWVKTLEDDEDVDSPEDTGEHWYYFNAKGKKVTSSKKTIGGKTYHFDEDGKMLSGWQVAKGDNAADESATVYYLGGEDEGWETRNEWRWLEKSGIDDDEEDEVTGQRVLGCAEDDDCDDEGWYWFDASGKLYHKTGEKTIKGRKFAFNKHGQMLYEWVYNKKVTPATYAMLDKATDGNISIDEMRWYQENGDGANNGARYKGWQYISGSESLNKAGDTNWYYFKDSKPKHADTVKDDTQLDDGSDNVYRKKEKLSWDGKTGTFCFDEFGKMKTGLQYIEGNTYFFNDDGYMQTGKVSNVEEADGDTFSYYFQTKNTGKGHGYTGEKDGYLYFMGKRLEADDDYRIYKVSGNYYIVNSKGKLQKSFKKKDVELANGNTEEDKDLAINNKNYKLAVKKLADGSLDLSDGQTKFINENAVIPHIQLDDTDNYILEDAILKADETDEAKGYDFLNQANLDAAIQAAAANRH
ncbi:MAG: glucan-binding protein [[Clostridium] aminophilum]|uniref:glucan-binding protein n=1 Tax=[Clostridium] aminophilum TaxID=1526 RepID=UPI0026ED22D1|nr:glucan-binding protein [[Clostridium] aminophilum]MDD6195392.1 glucan-binding protein [[Clostridium] aminophilum]